MIHSVADNHQSENNEIIGVKPFGKMPRLDEKVKNLACENITFERAAFTNILFYYLRKCGCACKLRSYQF